MMSFRVPAVLALTASLAACQTAPVYRTTAPAAPAPVYQSAQPVVSGYQTTPPTSAYYVPPATTTSYIQPTTTYVQPTTTYVQPTTTTGVAPDRTNETAAGTVLGAVAGGLLGSRFGQGTGKTAATIGGALIGGLIGNNLTRQYWTQQDQVYLQNTSQLALDSRQTQTWTNPQSNLRGEVTPVRYYDQAGQQCSEYRQTIYLPTNEYEVAQGVACRQADGSWRIVS